MFNLEKAVREWRQDMIANGVGSPAPLEELETHLREEVSRRLEAGVAERKAFLLAVEKLGSGTELCGEFRKVSGPPAVLNWKAFTWFFFAMVVIYPLLVAVLAFFVRNGKFTEMTLSQQLSSVTGALAFSAMAVAMNWACPRFASLRTVPVRNAIFTPVVLWLVAFAYFIMPTCNLDMSQSGVVSLWVFAPFGILVGWLWGNAAAGRHESSATA